jgi:hypothetical protein
MRPTAVATRMRSSVKYLPSVIENLRTVTQMIVYVGRTVTGTRLLTVKTSRCCIIKVSDVRVILTRGTRSSRPSYTSVWQGLLAKCVCNLAGLISKTMLPYKIENLCATVISKVTDKFFFHFAPGVNNYSGPT